jgi:hypothetical protein
VSFFLRFVGLRSVGDREPNAIDWANITFSAAGSASNALQTVAGMTNQGTLRVSWTGTAGLTMSVIGTGGDGSIASGGTQTFENGETLGFQAIAGAPGAGTNTVTIEYLNNSGSYVTWDTFTVTRT